MFERFREWLAQLRRTGGIDLPEGGRSSVEGTLSDQITGALGAFGSVSPFVDFEMLRCLKHLSVFNPDFSQFVSNVQNLGNTGHEIVVEAASPQRAEAAVARLNEAASRVYQNGAGVDGLVNAYLRQMAVFGAISSEDVVDFARARVDRVALVPVEQIRFRYEEGRYVPHQQPGTLAGLTRPPLGLVRLNDETYRYYALETIDNSPYAKPPGSAAVEALTGPQKDMRENIKYIAQKFGLLGLVSLAVTPPPRKPQETEAEYQSRAKKYLSSVRSSVAAHFKEGLLVMFRDQKLDHANVASDARGAKDIWELNEEQVFSGVGMAPAFFGRTHSVTETFADVVYSLMQAQVTNMQRLAKRRQEATYRLDLRLGGVEVDAVSVRFNAGFSRNNYRDALAEAQRTRTVLLKVEKGIISPDAGAQELGYDSAHDPELSAVDPEAAGQLHARMVGAGRAGNNFTASFRFDRRAQLYRFVPARVELGGAPADAGLADDTNVVPLKKKAA